MRKIFNTIKNKKAFYIASFFALLILIPVTISLCKIFTEENNDIYWNGEVATSYNSGDGTKTNPYIISSPEELAYLSENTNNGNDYTNTYFKISNDLYINKGVLEEKNNKLIYILNGKKYYLKNGTNEYYSDQELTNLKGTINNFPTINNFKGTIDGNNKFIYGLYITNNQDITTLFNIFSGTLNNLLISNYLISGSKEVSLFNNITNANISNILLNGYIYGQDISSPIINSTSSNYSNITLKGSIKSTNTSSGLIINSTNNTINNLKSIQNIESNNSYGLINNIESTTITKLILNNNIKSTNISSGLIGTLKNNQSKIEYIAIDGNIIGINTYPTIYNLNNYTLSKTASIYYTYDLTDQTNYGIVTPKENIYNSKFYTTDLNLKLSNTTWVFDSTNTMPHLYYDNMTIPEFTTTINGIEETTKDTININRVYNNFEFIINYNNITNDILKIEYYIDNNYNLTPLNESEIEWNIYTNPIVNTDNNLYTFYAKITDIYGNTYLYNSNMYILDKYTISLKDALNQNELITNNYQISKNTILEYHYNREMKYYKEYQNLTYKLNLLNNLPLNTKIYLIDNLNNKIYYYLVNTLTNNINLSEFKYIGNNTLYFENNPNRYLNNNKYIEDFTILINFEETLLEENITNNISLNIYDGEELITSGNNNYNIQVITLDNENNNIKSTININTTYNNILELNNLNEDIINLNININEATYNNYPVYDSNIKFKNPILNIKLVNGNNEIIKGNSINKITFIYNNKEYYANKSGIISIPLTYNNEIEVPIKIKREYLNNELLNGSYDLKFEVECNNIKSNTLTIPVLFNNTILDVPVLFEINSDINDYVLIKNTSKNLNNRNIISLETIYSSNLIDPKIIISLEKYNFNNNTYELVNLNTYLLNTLSESNQNNKYYLRQNMSNGTYNDNISLDISKFDIGGYKLKFELYDGNAKVREIEKSIVVR